MDDKPRVHGREHYLGRDSILFTPAKRCCLFHKWSKWEQITFCQQVRRCLRCGKYQVRMMKEMLP